MKKVVLVHFGRSGSTVFAKMIESATDVVWLHEAYSLIWQRMDDKAGYNFDSHGMMQIARDGVAQEAKPATKVIGLEAKLINFIHSGNCTMQEYLRAMKAEGDWDIVTLQRRNVLARILSIYRAAGSGEWHVKSGGQGKKKAVYYNLPMTDLSDPDTGVRGTDLVAFLRDVQTREANMMANLRKECDVALELVYEDHIRDDARVAPALFRETFGLPRIEMEATLRKTGSDVKEELKNFDAVSAALEGTEFEWMIREL